MQFCVLFPEVISYPFVPQKEPQVTSEVSWVLYISFSCFSLGLYHKVTSLITLLFTFEHSKLYISKIILWVFFYSYFINIYSWESSKSLHAAVIPAFLLLYSIILHKSTSIFISSTTDGYWLVSSFCYYLVLLTILHNFLGLHMQEFLMGVCIHVCVHTMHEMSKLCAIHYYNIYIKLFSNVLLSIYTLTSSTCFDCSIPLAIFDIFRL